VTAGGGAPGASAGPGGPEATGAAAPPEIVALVERLTAAVGEHASAAVEGGKLHWIRQVGELVGALPRGLREQVLDAALARLASGDGSFAALGELETTAAASEMLGSLRRLRSAGRRFAPHAVDWLDALMRSGAVARQTGAAASRQELEALLGEPEDRPALRADEPVLELPPAGGIPHDPSPLLADEIGRLTPQARGQQLLTTLLELLAEAGDDTAVAVMGRLETLFLELIQGQRLRPATALVAHLQDFAARRDDDVGAAVTAGLERLCGDDTVAVLLDVLPLLSAGDVEEVRALVRRFGRPMTRRLLLALGEEAERSRRRVLFDLLASLAAEVVDDARRLLADDRWYVVRNMIGLLRVVATADLAADLDACLDHEDARVRIEALRALADARTRLPPARLQALLADPEPKVTALAIRLSGQSGGGQAVGPLLAVVTPLDPLGRNRAMRVEALLALGEVGDPAVLRRIKRYFSGLAIDSAEERRAAFRSLAGYPPAARAPYVAKGLKSRDPEIRDLCRRLAREAGNG
jgi:HEAT repeat protein